MLLAYLVPLSFLIQGKPNQEGKKLQCACVCVSVYVHNFIFFQLHRNYSNSNEVPAMPPPLGQSDAATVLSSLQQMADNGKTCSCYLLAT